MSVKEERFYLFYRTFHLPISIFWTMSAIPNLKIVSLHEQLLSGNTCQILIGSILVWTVHNTCVKFAILSVSGSVNSFALI